jgi:hypothetical protein
MEVAMNRLLCFSLLTFLFQAGTASTPAQQPNAETGKFRIYFRHRAQMEETYRIEADGTTLVLTATPTWLHKQMYPLPETHLRMSPDLAPERLELLVPSSPKPQINFAIEIRGNTANVRDAERSRQVSVPHGAFPLLVPSSFLDLIVGRRSMSMRMMLVRYWIKRGKPSIIPTIPDGAVRFRYRGRDTVDLAGSPTTLERYSVSGIAWGEESMWLDSSQNLVAAVVGGGAAPWFQGFRDGYESSLSVFLASFARDGIENWKETASKVSAPQKPVLAVVGATLIDGTGSAPIPDSAVVVRNGRIVAAGSRSAVNVPQAAEIVSGKGKVLMPGLWDMHAHIEQSEWGAAYLAAGVTTVRDCGGEFEVLTAFRDAAHSDQSLSPQMLLAGVVQGKDPEMDWEWEAITPDQVPAAVKHYHDAGFQQIKILDSLSLEVLKALSIEAHRVGMTVTGHVPNGISTVQAVEAGEDQISHARFAAYPWRIWNADSRPPTADFESPAFKEAIQLFKEHITVFDPTLVHYEIPGCSPGEFCEPGIAKAPAELARDFVHRQPDPQAKERRRVFEEEIRAIGILHRAGLRIVAGTDQGVPGYSLHRELELHVKAGFTPMEAIQSATIVPAKVMNLDKEVGTIEAGKRADMILLDANPLEDISNIRTVRTVIANGRMFDSASLWQSVGFKP